MEGVAQTRLCRLDDLEEAGSRGVTALCSGRPHEAFVVRRDGEVHAYLNRCPHTGAPLDWVGGQFLDGDGKYIQCATHAALFRIHDGFCIAGPCSGQRLTPLPVVVRQGEVHLQTDRLPDVSE